MIHLTAELICPNCGEMLNGAENMSDHETHPDDGSITVCKFCIAILEFKGAGNNMKLRIVSYEELLKIKEEDEEDYVNIMLTVMMLEHEKRKNENNNTTTRPDERLAN